jgi:hypothetical protein
MQLTVGIKLIYVTYFADIQGEHKVFPWLQTFITRKVRGIQTFLFQNVTQLQKSFLQHISTLKHVLLLLHGECLIDKCL